MTTVDTEHSPAVKRLSRDLVEAGKTMSDEEARFLVDVACRPRERRGPLDSPSSLVSCSGD